ncbi:MAG: 2-oxo acid dehydrogenase subunit E2 [Candidatus Dormibacteraeota bacterium]|uniref:Dihydrolipoamide acetyltransferase component of pyruvate dehydrogenase complex n=2 Tax=Candidatus Dormiibacter inghamiae TaxID=3127013 RepID=A0A934KBS7_9BACT|nr:2-oxo acid dehydrogenase subunit E2 [Candidatus Dormibacteraeota bacterium]MBJ7605334.1 2-oxo acid dehydrogenase subunit E2 [Candidatus Dormibacteraeota bacterium]
MPQLGESVTEGTVDKWLKQEGDHVKRDEPLVEVVTDKVNAEIPSPFEGRLVQIAVKEGTTVPIGTVLAQMEVADAAPEAQVAAEQAELQQPQQADLSTAAAQATAEATVVESAVGPSASAASGAAITSSAARADGDGVFRARFSPAVRRLAEEHRLDPSFIQGSGLGGRVTRDDVLAQVAKQGGEAKAAEPRVAEPQAPSVRPEPAQSAPPEEGTRVTAGDAPEELVRISAMRRSIAEHMTRSLATSPHAWTLQEIDMTELVRYREAEKSGFAQRNGTPLTYLPFVIQVLGDALHEFPLLNSSWTDDGILLKRYINVGLAVAIPDGLIVPVIHNADRLGFSDLARAAGDLVQRARSRRLRPEDVQGGTFTLNNTGPTGSVASQPILNQPQVAILTTESIVKRPVVIGEGIAVRHMMNMCISFDHRVIDGKLAGDFLGLIKSRLEGWTPAAIRI